MSAPYRMLR